MKIRYLTLHGAAEWSHFDDSDRDMLLIDFTSPIDGIIAIGDRSYTLSGGKVTIPISEIKTGEHRPVITCDGGIFIAEGFVKDAKGIRMMKTDEETVRRLVKRCHALEKTCDVLAKKVAHLEQLCQGHNIFNFERTEQ